MYDRASAANRTIFLSSYQDYAVIRGGRIYRGNRRASSDDDQPLEVFDVVGYEPGRPRFFAGKAGSEKMPAIQGFDDFQARFLKNYDLYRNDLIKP